VGSYEGSIVQPTGTIPSELVRVGDFAIASLDWSGYLVLVFP
jgi:hypothetical protein